uniref:Uncharacterized protein n=1 Tax=Rhizophora mucronata TaxID=61149 RepID=A0A2P2PR32_RHIMU
MNWKLESKLKSSINNRTIIHR